MTARGNSPGYDDAAELDDDQVQKYLQDLSDNTEEIQSGDDAKAKYLRELAEIDLRDGIDSGSEDEQGADDEVTQSHASCHASCLMETKTCFMSHVSCLTCFLMPNMTTKHVFHAVGCSRRWCIPIGYKADAQEPTDEQAQAQAQCHQEQGTFHQKQAPSTRVPRIGDIRSRVLLDG